MPGLALCVWLQVRYLRGLNTRLQEKLAHAERSAAASLAQKVRAALNDISARDAAPWAWLMRHAEPYTATLHGYHASMKTMSRCESVLFTKHAVCTHRACAVAGAAAQEAGCTTGWSLQEPQQKRLGGEDPCHCILCPLIFVSCRDRPKYPSMAMPRPDAEMISP